MLTHSRMGLWSEYFLKTPPGDSNMCPLSTPVVELAIQQLPKVLGFSQKDTGFSEKKFRSNETVCVCLENPHALCMHCMDIFIDV